MPDPIAFDATQQEATPGVRFAGGLIHVKFKVGSDQEVELSLTDLQAAELAARLQTALE